MEDREQQVNALQEQLFALALTKAPVGRIVDTAADALVAMGVPLARIRLAASTLHPEISAVGARWDREGVDVEGGVFTHSEQSSANWLRSPIYHMMKERIPRMRRRLIDPGVAEEFLVFQDFLNEGLTDYLAHLVAFGERPEKSDDGMIVRWMSDAPEGFAESDITLLDRLAPQVAAAALPGLQDQIARNLLNAYVGQRCGARILDGVIQPGAVIEIEAVIMVTDLKGFTAASDRIAGDQLVAALDRQFEAMLPPIVERGGEVLAFLGDGVLAVFEIDKDVADDERSKCRLAIDAALDAVDRTGRLDEVDGLGALPLDVALHMGTVQYGNVGAAGRQAFTVIGPAVNIASRIESLCGDLGQSVLITKTVADAAGDPRLRSCGDHMLKGLAYPIEVFSVGPESPVS